MCIRDRVATAAFNRVEGNSADSRLTIYAYILQNVNFLDYFMFGHGVRTLVNGAAVSYTHLDVYKRQDIEGHLFMWMQQRLLCWLEMLNNKNIRKGGLRCSE